MNYKLYNLQHNNSDDRFDFLNHSALENYVIAKGKMRNRYILDVDSYNNFVNSAAKDISTAAYNEINKMIKSIKAN